MILPPHDSSPKAVLHTSDGGEVVYEEFMERLDEWMRDYSTSRLKGFREDGKTVYDTIDNRRRRLGYAA